MKHNKNMTLLFLKLTVAEVCRIHWNIIMVVRSSRSS